MDIAAIRKGLAANASVISGLRSVAFVPGKVEPPMFFVGEVDISFDRAYARGLDEVTVICRLFTSFAYDRSGQALLDSFLAGSGASSVKAAVEAAPTLGGACADLRVQRISGYGVFEHNGNQYYGAEFTVHVIGEG